MKRTLFLYSLVLAILAPRSIWAQATVNESLETALIYVDTNTGSDSNPGTQALPLQTISAGASIATANNMKGIGTKVIINPGTYREAVVVDGNSYATALPITFEASGAGVIVSGAIPYTGWQQYSGNTAIYKTAWANEWGLCAPNLDGPTETDIVLRREMVFVGGVPLTQVLTLGEMREGTFSVDETNHWLYIWPLTGTNVSTANIEVATLPQLFHLVDLSNVVVRGLTFKYANTCRDNPAVYIAGTTSNVLFDTDNFLWNNAVGMQLFEPVTNFTVQNTVASHNGQSGMMSVMTKYALWTSDTTSFNNWRGAQGSYYNWNSGGIHFFNAHDHTITGLITAYNQTHGVHWDTDNANVTVTDLISDQNLAMGAVVEKSEGPVSISNSHFCGNNLGVKFTYLYQYGLALRNSENVTLTNSTFYNNQIGQIGVIGQAGGIEVTNWETGVTLNLVTQSFTQTGNNVEAVGSAQNTFTDGYLNGSDWTAFQTTLNSNKNNWWNGSASSVFEVPVSTMHPFSGWQSVTAQDGNSTWEQPATSPSTACGVEAAADYWLLVDNPGQTSNQVGSAVFTLDLLPFGSFTGTATLGFDGVKEVSGLSADLSTASVTLPGTATLTVKDATSTVPGVYPITMIATANGVTRTVAALLTVPTTSLRLSAIALDFGTVKAKTASPVQSFTLTNFGTTSMSLASFAFAGAKDYTETNTCGAALKAGTSCTVSVTFTPKVTGPRNGTLKITDGDATSPQVITLTGSGD